MDVRSRTYRSSCSTRFREPLFRFLFPDLGARSGPGPGFRSQLVAVSLNASRSTSIVRVQSNPWQCRNIYIDINTSYRKRTQRNYMKHICLRKSSALQSNHMMCMVSYHLMIQYEESLRTPCNIPNIYGNIHRSSIKHPRHMCTTMTIKVKALIYLGRSLWGFDSFIKLPVVY